MQYGYGVGGGATAIESTRRRWVAVLLAIFVVGAVVLVSATLAFASSSGEEDLQPGWDNHPAGEGTVEWSSSNSGELEVTYTIEGGPGDSTFDVGLIQTDVGDGVMLTGVVGGSFDFTGIGIGPFTREFQTVGPYNAWIFGEEFTTSDDDGFGDGSVTVTLTGNPGTYDVQFIVLPDGTTTPSYESAGVFGTTVEVTIIDGSCDPAVEGDCSEEDESGSGADVLCVDGNCLPVILTPEDPGDDNASFSVDTLANPKGEVFEMVVTMATRALSTPPGKAEVEMDPDDGDPFILDRCTQTDEENCVVSITRIRGGLTQYTIRFAVDPRFRFR
jgi:hypothetical protein